MQIHTDVANFLGQAGTFATTSCDSYWQANTPSEVLSQICHREAPPGANAESDSYVKIFFEFNNVPAVYGRLWTHIVVEENASLLSTHWRSWSLSAGLRKWVRDSLAAFNADYASHLQDNCVAKTK